MPETVDLPISLKNFLARRPGARLEKIHAEASRRGFFRIRQGNRTLVAMVYPEPSSAEIEKFCAAQAIYAARGLRVPRIDDVLDDQVVIQEDLGDRLLQKAWRDADARERQRLIRQCREILGGLAAVHPRLATARLDRARRKWEMDFFISHFYPHFAARSVSAEALRARLHALVDAVPENETYAHRDFHSRNLLVLGKEIVMVDFQDSLLAPRYYDLVSLAFDSYLDLNAARGALFPNLVACDDDGELRQMRLTALQRNIKALGTFAFQIFERRHRVYARYIPRTLRHIGDHLRVLADPQLALIAKYFESVTRKA